MHVFLCLPCIPVCRWWRRSLRADRNVSSESGEANYRRGANRCRDAKYLPQWLTRRRSILPCRVFSQAYGFRKTPQLGGTATRSISIKKFREGAPLTVTERTPIVVRAFHLDDHNGLDRDAMSASRLVTLYTPDGTREIQFIVQFASTREKRTERKWSCPS